MRARASSLDLDLPIEVDDEYWENDDPELAFRQPEGKPAVVSCFIHWIKLSHIIAYALKTLVGYLPLIFTLPLKVWYSTPRTRVSPRWACLARSCGNRSWISLTTRC